MRLILEKTDGVDFTYGLSVNLRGDYKIDGMFAGHPDKRSDISAHCPELKRHFLLDPDASDLLSSAL